MALIPEVRRHCFSFLFRQLGEICSQQEPFCCAVENSPLTDLREMDILHDVTNLSRSVVATRRGS